MLFHVYITCLLAAMGQTLYEVSTVEGIGGSANCLFMFHHFPLLHTSSSIPFSLFFNPWSVWTLVCYHAKGEKMAPGIPP